MKWLVHWNKKLWEQGKERKGTNYNQCIHKGEILTNLDYIHKVDNCKVKTWWQELWFDFTEVYFLPIGEDSKYWTFTSQLLRSSQIQWGAQPTSW